MRVQSRKANKSGEKENQEAFYELQSATVYRAVDDPGHGRDWLAHVPKVGLEGRGRHASRDGERRRYGAAASRPGAEVGLDRPLGQNAHGDRSGVRTDRRQR